HGWRLVVQVRHPAPEDAVVVLVPHRGAVPRLPAPGTFAQECRGEAVPRAIGRRRVPQRRAAVGVLARAGGQPQGHEPHAGPGRGSKRGPRLVSLPWGRRRPRGPCPAWRRVRLTPPAFPWYYSAGLPEVLWPTTWEPSASISRSKSPGTRVNGGPCSRSWSTRARSCHGFPRPSSSPLGSNASRSGASVKRTVGCWPAGREE